ncbi:hypothetical protein CEK28_08730, partial [Xenophilus sp. AP218F]
APAGDVGQSLAAANTKADQALAGLDGKASASSVQQLQAQTNRNLIDTSGWRPGASMPIPGYRPQQNNEGESSIILAEGPYGEQMPVWRGVGKGGNGDGGWDYDNIPVDEQRNYRLSVWIKPVSGNAKAYLGTRNVSTIPDGIPQSNPYFLGGFPRERMTMGRWHLFVGYIYPSDYQGNNPVLSGVFDGVTGARLSSNYDFKFTTGTKVCTHRAYQYYGEEGAEQWFALPRFEVCDGNEPTIADLLSGATRNSANAALSRLSTVETDLKGKAGAQDLTALRSTVGANQSAVEKQLKTLSEEGRAIGQSIEKVSAAVGANKAAADSQITALADADKALTGRVDGLAATVGNNQAAVNNQLRVLADADKAIGLSVEGVSATVAANQAAVEKQITTLTTTNAANAQEIGKLTARLAPAGDVGQSLAAANTKADQALAGLDGKASASSVQQLQAAVTADQAVGAGGNLLLNADFSVSTRPGVPDGWVVSTKGGKLVFASGKNYSAWCLQPAETSPNTWFLQQKNTPPIGDEQLVLQQSLSPSIGQKYILSAYLGTHRCKGWVELQAQDDAGNVLEKSVLGVNPNGPGGGSVLSAFARVSTSLTIPNGCKKLVCRIGRDATLPDPRWSDSWLFIVMPQLEAATADATVPGTWSMGRPALAESMAAAMDRIATVETNVKDKADAKDVTALTARVGGAEASVTVLQQATATIDGKLMAKAGMVLGAKTPDGRQKLAGIQGFNDGTTSGFVITADQVLIQPSGSALNRDPYFSDPEAWEITNNRGGGVVRFGASALSPGANHPTCVHPDNTVGTANAEVWLREKQMTPIDARRTYRLTGNFYSRPGNNRSAYLAVLFYDQAGNYIPSNGWGAAWSGYPWYGAPPGDGQFREYDGTFGVGTSKPIPANATQCRVGVILNYGNSGADGKTMAVQSVRLEEVLPGTLIQNGAITTDKLVANAVTVDKLAANSVTTEKLVAGSVVADRIATAAITAAKIDVNAVQAQHIASDSISARHVQVGTLTGEHLQARSVGAKHLSADAISAMMVNVSTSSNFLGNAAPVSLDDWRVNWNRNATPYDFGLNIPNDDWRPIAGNCLALRQGNNDPDAIIDIAPSHFPVVPGQWYQVSAYTGAHRCKLDAAILFLDRDGNQISKTHGTPNDETNRGGRSLTGYHRTWAKAAAPANAHSAMPLFRKYGTKPGQADSWMFLTRLYFGEASADQTEPSVWEPGGVGTLIGGGMIRSNSITADKMAVGSLDAISARIGTLRTATSGARTEISDNVIKVFDQNNVLRVRIGNLDL